MKYVDEFRDRDKALALVREIETLANSIGATRQRPIQIMEVCGGHTHSIFRYGIETMLPELVELVHGPGCPVCVLPMGRIDDCIAIAAQPRVILTTFGDAMRVPGSRGRIRGGVAARRQGLPQGWRSQREVALDGQQHQRHGRTAEALVARGSYVNLVN